MLQIIDEQRKPSFRNQLMSGLGQASSVASTQIPEMLLGRQRERQESQAIKRLTGQDVTGLSPEMRKVFLDKHLGSQGAKQQEKQHTLQRGLETIDRMRSLISSAGPTNFIQGLFGGETTKNRAELEALGRSLIPLVAAGVPIRNQKEFEEYRKVITNPNARQAELEGALDGLQGLFERSLTQPEGQEKEFKKNKVKFNPAHPEHQAKARQLYKLHKDKARVRKELEREFAF